MGADPARDGATLDHPADEDQVGSCNRATGHIWFNVELAKKRPDYLEYVVHEMHLQRSHGQRFTALMDNHMPTWRARRDQLNAAPLAHEQWTKR